MKNKHEQTFCTKLQKWMKYNIHSSIAWEAKIVMGTGTLNYKAIPAHELRNLKLAKHKKIIHKFSDYSRLGTIFDGFMLYKVPAYIVVQWIRRGNKRFYMIDIDRFLEEIKSGSKSLTEERAKYIGLICDLS